jgi:hypothetical protein
MGGASSGQTGKARYGVEQWEEAGRGQAFSIPAVAVAGGGLTRHSPVLMASAPVAAVKPPAAIRVPLYTCSLGVEVGGGQHGFGAALGACRRAGAGWQGR